MGSLASCSERDLKPIKMKKLELDAALKTWGNLINQAENVLCDFDKYIEAFKERESKRTRFTLACACALIGKRKTVFHIFLSLLVNGQFLLWKTKILEKNYFWVIYMDSSFIRSFAFLYSAVLHIALRYWIGQYLYN